LYAGLRFGGLVPCHERVAPCLEVAELVLHRDQAVLEPPDDVRLRGDLKTRRNALVARHKTAEAQTRVQGALSTINVLDPTREISRFEETVRREEANAAGQAEVAASSLDAQFDELKTSSENIEIEARLAALKAGHV
jgi:hypothetical protein